MDPYAFRYHPENPIILDFYGCNYVDEIHLRIKEAFGFPEYYGMNWDAMWDCINGYFDENESRTIQIRGFQSMPTDWQEYCNPMWDIFSDLQKECRNLVVCRES